jgi:hypothetical protein
MYVQHNTEARTHLYILNRWSYNLIHWCHPFCSRRYSQFVHTLHNVTTVAVILLRETYQMFVFTRFLLNLWVTYNPKISDWPTYCNLSLTDKISYTIYRYSRNLIYVPNFVFPGTNNK